MLWLSSGWRLFLDNFLGFVNGLVDTGQKSSFAAPITHLAEKIGLPRVFVEMRHEATHNQLPTLSILRGARDQVSLGVDSLDQALRWLHANYWQKQLEVLRDNR